MRKEIPSNWTDYVQDSHKEFELENKILNNFKIFINDKVIDFKNIDNLIYFVKIYFQKHKTKIKKIAINNTTENFIEILICTKISQRLFRIKKKLDNIFLQKENIETIGDKDYFYKFSNQFIFFDLKI